MVNRKRTHSIMAKRKIQKDKQQSTKHTQKTKDRATRIPLMIGDELRCSGIVCSSRSTSGTCRVNLVTNPVISHEWCSRNSRSISFNSHLITFYSVICFCFSYSKAIKRWQRNRSTITHNIYYAECSMSIRTC